MSKDGKRVVVHIFGEMATGGAELRMLDVVRLLAEEGCHFEFVTLTGRRGELAPEFEDTGAVVVPNRLSIGFALRFVRYLRRVNADVVHSHVALFSGTILTLARLGGVQVRIAHFHSDGDGQKATLLREFTAER